ncbi:long-chain fatty acid--CoA ligase [Streptomyces sp. NBC_01571]|uniref:class I adenylate-forming enzyme family protein n=1 Tax=Streptomyces sp. NBC_01571 TaxID=2975883 RepID=UPI0022551678|nr:long-chain fatty acid--CoA ligase [Streptomyces sp. NBC_01571]MCX4571641.1 long-chain fatty acid--CoA ligase [Streptomyces sp. NBC_01571]MCX4580950.1 long-chain fatty acid--CoA ligase [Streptomyces sp. NBC_01571]
MPILRYPQSPLDDLLRRAADRDGDAPAVVTAGAAVTYAALDREADRIARYVGRTVRRADAVVAAATTLDTAFPAVYYGTVRSGRLLALLDPRMGPAALHEVCAAAGVEIAFVPGALAALLAALADRLPRLHTIVVTDPTDPTGRPAPVRPAPGGSVSGGWVPDRQPSGVQLSGVQPSGVPVSDVAVSGAAVSGGQGACAVVALSAALAAVPATGSVRRARPGVDAVACLQFAPDGGGRLKGVRMTHRNLVAGAAQTALAHRLGASSVVLNHLPQYHAVHLNSAVHAGARQVLCTDPDPFGALAEAARAEATHYYGLPARLDRLAGDSRLAAGRAHLPGRHLSAIHVSGGVLAPERARALRDALRVSVLQGYGLTEVFTLSHHQPPGSRPGLGAVGVPLPGTECRVVLPGSTRPAAVWSTGEVQIRGPQLSPGPADGPGPAPRDADGWLATGDTGYLDADGGLHLVDAHRSVFTCDDALVAPSVVERVIGQDPRVADCIVADWPDPARGALVWAGVVLREAPDGDAPGLLDVLDSVAEQANARLGPGEQIRRLEALDAVPRRPGGRPARRELRLRLHALAAGEAAA